MSRIQVYSPVKIKKKNTSLKKPLRIKSQISANFINDNKKIQSIILKGLWFDQFVDSFFII